MKLDIAQRSWVIYDMGNAAYALIVRTVFAALLFKYCANDIWGEENTTAYWGYVCSLAGIAAGAVSITLGFYADKHHCKKPGKKCVIYNLGKLIKFYGEINEKFWVN